MGGRCKVASAKLQDGDRARRTREFLQHNPMHMPGNDFLNERPEAQGRSDATESLITMNDRGSPFTVNCHCYAVWHVRR